MSEQFNTLCSEGQLKDAQLLLLSSPSLNILDHIEEAFYWACSHGHLEVAQWLFHLASTPLASTPTIPLGIVEAKEGGVEAKKGGINISLDDGEAFCSACENGHLKVAQWLFHLASTIPNGIGRVEAKEGGIDFSVKIEHAFRSACTYGHLEVAQWLLHLASTPPSLASTFLKGRVEVKEGGIDISAKNEEAFWSACANGYLEIAQWLLQIKPTINISADNECAFRYACYNGHLEVQKWLLSINPNFRL